MNQAELLAELKAARGRRLRLDEAFISAIGKAVAAGDRYEIRKLIGGATSGAPIPGRPPAVDSSGLQADETLTQAAAHVLAVRFARPPEDMAKALRSEARARLATGATWERALIEARDVVAERLENGLI